MGKNCLLVVTPVKTARLSSPKSGVQAVLKGSKILDSGFRRNEGKKTQADFFTPSGRGRDGLRARHLDPVDQGSGMISSKVVRKAEET